MNGRILNERLISRIEEVLIKIFPNGKKAGKEFAVGNIEGDPGESLKVVTEGAKAGVWKDFATEETGDLIELWIKALCQGDAGKGMSQIREFLGLPAYRADSKFQSTVSNKFSLPPKNWGKLSKEAGMYLVSRGLSKKTIIDSEIAGYKSNWKEPKKWDGELGNCYVFLYYDEENGRKTCRLSKPVAVKRTRNGKKVEWTSQGCKPILWGMRLPIPDGWDKYSVVITEGEIDALSYREQGIFAVSVPFGASNHQWVEYCYDWLSQFQTIYISFDNDEEGRSGAKVLADRLGRDRVREVVFKGEKDGNDVLRTNKGLLLDYLNKAKSIEHDKVASADDLLNKTLAYISKGRPELQGIPFMGWEGKDSINFKLRPSEMTIHTGYPQGGKSTGVYQLISYLALKHKQPSAIASTEVDPEQVIYTMAAQCLGTYIDPTEPADMKMLKAVAKELLKYVYVFDFKGIAKVDEMMDFFSYCCRVKGATHCVLDSATNSDVNLEDARDANEFLSRMISVMHYTKAHFHLVVHVRKGEMNNVREIPKFDAIKGTQSFGALTFNCLTWWRNYAKTDAIDDARRKNDLEKERYLVEQWADTKLVISKQKIGGQIGEFNLWYDPDCYAFSRSGKVEPIFQLTEDDEINVNQPF